MLKGCDGQIRFVRHTHTFSRNALVLEKLFRHTQKIRLSESCAGKGTFLLRKFFA